jgi:membrane protein implicated in regulation of membrane protease activity
MQWWAWIAVGAVLLGSELAWVNAQFYLVFLGAAALLVGLGELAQPVPAWLQWLAFAALAGISMVGFRRRIYDRMRRRLPAMPAGPAGEVVVLADALPPGETRRIEFRGSSWSALNAGVAVIPAGARARIDRVDGLTLVVRAE